MNGAVMVMSTTVDQDEVRAGVAEVLDDAEQVVPAAGIEPGGVVAELVEDLLHLESGRDGLDQHRGPDGAVRDAERLLGEDEDVVPEPRLEMALHLGQVVVRAVTVIEQLLGEVEKVQTEVDQGADALAASTRTWSSSRCQPRGRVTTTASGASVRSAYSRPFSATKDRVLLAASRRLRIASRTFGQVGQLASSRSASQTLAPELSALMAILAGVAGPVISTRRSTQRGRCRGDLPVALPGGRSLGKEVQGRCGRGLLAAGAPGFQQLVATIPETLVKLCHERQRLRGENLRGVVEGAWVGQLDGHGLLLFRSHGSGDGHDHCRGHPGIEDTGDDLLGLNARLFRRMDYRFCSAESQLSWTLRLVRNSASQETLSF